MSRPQDFLRVGEALRLKEQFAIPEKYRDGPESIYVVVEIIHSPNPRRPGDTQVVLLVNENTIQFPIGTCRSIFQPLVPTNN